MPISCGAARARCLRGTILIAVLLSGGFAGVAVESARNDDLFRLIAGLDKVKVETTRRKLEDEILAAARQRKPEEGQAKPLLDALAIMKDVEAKNSLFRVLGDLADPAALDVLTAAAQKGNIPAVEALGKWPETEPEGILYDLAKHGPGAAVKEKALDGYIHVLRLPHETPAEKTIARIKEALGMATTLAQKRAALAGLSELPSEASLAIVEQYLDDAELGKEAAVAAARIRNAN